MSTSIIIIHEHYHSETVFKNADIENNELLNRNYTTVFKYN